MKYSPDERNADFLARRSGPGVFYATGCGETQVGTRQNGRRIIPAEWGLIKEATYDCGDGFGNAWVEHDPLIALSTGGVRGLRRVHRLGGNNDWNIRPWQHMPLNWLERRVNGARLPVATNRIDPTLPKSRYNSKGLIAARHFFYQFSLRSERDFLWAKPLYWTTPAQEREYGCKGARIGLHQNKLIFITGGQSSDQVAITWRPDTGDIRFLFYNGNSTQGISPVLVGGLVEPDEWTTFQVLFSDQVDTAANDDRLIKATKGPIGYPRFVALWGARYGEPPQLIGYTNHTHPENCGPALRGSQVADRALTNKVQDANGDDYASDPRRVLGAAHGFPAPTREALYTVRDRSAMVTVKNGGTAISTRYFARMNAHWRAGRLPNYAAGCPLGFTSGALAEAAHIPRHRNTGRLLSGTALQRHKQFEIDSSEYAGRSIVVDGEPHEVHLIRLAEPAPFAPAEGDGLFIGLSSRHGKTERIPNYPDSRMYYGEPILSTREIPTPHQPGVPLPMPWM